MVSASGHCSLMVPKKYISPRPESLLYPQFCSPFASIYSRSNANTNMDAADAYRINITSITICSCIALCARWHFIFIMRIVEQSWTQWADKKLGVSTLFLVPLVRNSSARSRASSTCSNIECSFMAVGAGKCGGRHLAKYVLTIAIENGNKYRT